MMQILQDVVRRLHASTPRGQFRRRWERVVGLVSSERSVDILVIVVDFVRVVFFVKVLVVGEWISR